MVINQSAKIASKIFPLQIVYIISLKRQFNSPVLHNNIISGDQRPVSKDLNRFLTHYCKHWRATGLQLGLKSSVLDQVEADYHTMSERFRVTLEKWLQLNVGVTWTNLELAITNANRESLGLQPLTTGKENVILLKCFLSQGSKRKPLGDD